MIKSRYFLIFLTIFLMPSIRGISQTETFPDPPKIKSYKGVAGKVTKYNNFNFLDIRDEETKTNRQAMGRYWEISYSYDSVFRQKRRFKEFVENEIIAAKGKIFYQDTLQDHFVIPAEGGNIWGRLMLASDKVYRLRLIKEQAFVNRIQFDTKPVIPFDKFVDSIALPPRITYLPNCLITRILHSKYDHQEFTWNNKDTLYRQKVMGPYWDIKIEARNSKNAVDRQVSSVEILESYYRACVKAGGKIVRSRPRELLLTLPLDKATLWGRITVSLDGVYFVRTIIESDQDRTVPVKTVTPAAPPADSTKIKSGQDGR